MPSEDPRVRLALDALARPIAEFRSAITGALVQAEAALAEANADTGTRRAKAHAELGAFADGRIAPDAFAALADPAPVADLPSRDALARGVAVLRTVTGRGEDLFLADVPPGGSLGQIVGVALAEAGRAFGALVLAELARGGRYCAGDHDRLLEAIAFRDWNRAERRFAPPLVVSVDGADLHAGALAGFCDGREKLVLVVRGPCAPAALVRLITPGTLVLQTMDRAGLDRLVAHEGPSVAALVPEGAARFLHDPSAGREPWQRLAIASLPEAPRRSLGGFSAWQMAEDLQQLATLARAPSPIPAADTGAGVPTLGGEEAIERLAAWLLSRSDSLAASTDPSR
jgi:hypothetical protein